MINLLYLDICLQLLKHLENIKDRLKILCTTMGFLMDLNNKIKVIKRISYGYRSFSDFKAKVLLIFSLFTPSETNKKPRYSTEERQAILSKKKEIRLK